MVMMAPQARKHLSADALLGLLQTDFADIADRRSGKPDISLTDALVSALALFSLEPPSLLAFDKEGYPRKAGRLLKCCLKILSRPSRA